MLSKNEYLLICLIEELSEVQQELSKCLRFSLNHMPEVYDTTNAKRAALEFADVFAIIELLEAEGIAFIDFNNDSFFNRVKDKKKRTLKYMEESRKMKILEKD